MKGSELEKDCPVGDLGVSIRKSESGEWLSSSIMIEGPGFG